MSTAHLRFLGSHGSKLSALGLVLGLMFILLAMAVQLGVTQSMDERILQGVRQMVLKDAQTGRVWGEESVVAVTSLGAVAVLAGLSGAVVGLLFMTRQKYPALLLLLTLSGALGLNYSLKALFNRARPEVVARLQHVDTPSFPSGHALISTSVYAVLGVVTARFLKERCLKIYVLSLAITVTFLIGLSRVYLGVHYPSDVLAGWAIGLLWALVSWRLGGRLEPRIAG